MGNIRKIIVVVSFLVAMISVFVGFKWVNANESSYDSFAPFNPGFPIPVVTSEFVPQYIKDNPWVICDYPLEEWKTAPRCDKEPDFIGQSVPLFLTNDLGFNAYQAVNANNGALRIVEIMPKHEWSFNSTVGDPAYISNLRTVWGVYGGGWCDLASRYVQAVRPLLPDADIRFINHNISAGMGLADVDYNDAVAIWNTGGLHGNIGEAKDLVLWNGSDYGIRLWVVEDGTTLIVRSTWFDPNSKETQNVR